MRENSFAIPVLQSPAFHIPISDLADNQLKREDMACAAALLPGEIEQAPVDPGR